MLLPLVLVRIFSPADVGAFKLFFLYLMLLPGFSMTSGIVSGLAYWAGQNQAERRQALTVSGMSMLALGLVASAIALVVDQYDPTLFYWADRHSTAFSLALCAAIAGTFFEEAAIATGRIWSGALFSSVLELIRTSAIVAAAFLYRDLGAVFFAHTAVVLLKLLLGYALCRRFELIGSSFGLGGVKAVWRYALPVSVAGILAVFLTRADQVVLSLRLSPEDFAFYAVGCLVVPPLFILEQSVTRVLIPQLSEEFASGGARRGASLYRQAVEQLAFLVIPAVVGLIVFAGPIIELLFTEQYSASSGFLQLYALTYLLLIIPFDAVPRAQASGHWILRVYSIFSLGSLASAYVLGTTLGPYGALSGVILAGLALRLYALAYIHTRTGWKMREFLPFGSAGRITAVCAVLAAASYAARPLFHSTRTWFLLCAPLFAAVYLGGFWRRRAIRMRPRLPGEEPVTPGRATVET